MLNRNVKFVVDYMTTPEDYTLEQLEANRDEAAEQAKYAAGDFMLANDAYTLSHAAWYAATRGFSPRSTINYEWLHAWLAKYLDRAEQTITDYLGD